MGNGDPCRSCCLRATNCRFLKLTNGPCVTVHGGGLHELRNCELVTPPRNHTIQYWSPSSDSTYIVENCCLTATINIAQQPADLRAATLRLRRNTVLGNACVYVPIDSLRKNAAADASGPSICVEASQNVFNPAFDWPVLLANYSGDSPPQTADLAPLVPRLANWQGERNLFPADRRLLEASVGFDRKQAESVADLTGWSRFWGPTDSDSLQGRIQLQGDAILDGLYTSPEKIQAEDFRLRPDSPGYRAGPDGKDLGADVDLVGPGAAYERWKKTPEYQDWLRDVIEKTPERTSAALGPASDEADDVEPLRLVRRFAEHDTWFFNALRFAPDGETAVTSCPEGIDVWSLETGERLERFVAPDAEMKSLSFLDGGKVLAGLTRQGRLLGRDWPSGNIRFDVDAHLPEGTQSFPLSDSQIGTVGYDGFVRIWDARTGRKIKELSESGGNSPYHYYCLAFSADKRHAVVGGGWKAHVWDVREAKLIHKLPGHEFEVSSVAISPDGRHVLTGGSGGLVQLFDLESGDLLRRFEKHTAAVCSLEFLPDGRHFVSGSLDRTLRVWAIDGREVARHASSKNDVSALCVAPDGRRMLSAGRLARGQHLRSGAIQLWELPASEAADMGAGGDARIQPMEK